MRSRHEKLTLRSQQVIKVRAIGPMMSCIMRFRYCPRKRLQRLDARIVVMNYSLNVIYKIHPSLRLLVKLGH